MTPIPALKLLPPLPDPEDPAPAPRLTSVPLWSGWSLGLTPGRALPPPAAPAPPPEVVTPDAIEPARRLRHCHGCGRRFGDEGEFLFHPCAQSRIEIVVLFDVINLDRVKSTKRKRKCSPFPRARTKNLSKIANRRIKSGARTAELFDVELERLRPKKRGECHPGPWPCPWCKRPFDTAEVLHAQDDRLDREEIWKAHGAGTGGDASRSDMAGSNVEREVRLREDGHSHWGGLAQREEADVRLQSEAARDVRNPGIQRMEQHGSALRESEERQLSTLRRTGDPGMRSVEGAGWVHQVLRGHGTPTVPGAFAGSEGQQRQLRAGQLPVGDPQGAAKKPSRLSCPHCGGRVRYGLGMGGTQWTWQNDYPGADQARVESGAGDLDARLKNHRRPCGWLMCRHHNAFTVNEENGSVKENYPHLRIWDDPEGAGLHALEALYGSCSLDVADRADDGTEGVAGLLALYDTATSGRPIGNTAGLTLEEAAKASNLSIERLRQLGAKALQDVRVALRRLEAASPGEARR